MARYLFDTGVYLRWETLPQKWHKYRREVEAGRADVVLFEALLAEAAWKLCAQHGGARLALRRLQSIASRPRARFRVADPVHIIVGSVKLNRQRAAMPARTAGLSLVDRLILLHAGDTGACIVTLDAALAAAGRLLGLEVDWVPTA